MSKLKSLTIFFPAYNEANNITETIQRADQVAQSTTDDYEILIINDGSQDQTSQMVKSLQLKYPSLKLIDHPENRGYGAALLSGLEQATKEWTFFSDADLQFDFTEIENFLPFINKFSVIIGYRKDRQDHLVRSLNALGWNILNRILFGLKVKDVDCAFKLIRTSIYKPVLPNLVSGGAMLEAELLIRLKKLGFQFKEIPVQHFPRKSGSSTGANIDVILRAFKEMAKVYWNITSRPNKNK